MEMESYHTQHAPFGAFASFTVGLVGGTGGFGQSLSAPANQNVYAGFRRQGENWKVLPFFAARSSGESAFSGEARLPEKEGVDVLSPADYRRELRLASDSWRAGEFVFTLHTPFEKVPDPSTLDAASARRLLAPVIYGTISFDNTEWDTPVELIFGVNNPAQQFRPFCDSDPRLFGFAQAGDFGFVTPQAQGVRHVQGFNLFGTPQHDPRGLFLLGNESGFIFTVPPGKSVSFPLVLGFYQGGRVTTGLPGTYLYTRYFSDLEDVLLHGLARYPDAVAEARRRDSELAQSPLSADQQFLVAQAIHSYFGSTELLDCEGRIVWVVNEGEYRMMNTFDLTVDQIFFELRWHPWAVRNVIDLFADRYSYYADLRLPGGEFVPGGISFTHDMGVMNHFTPAGISSYECVDLEGCFSHMTMEQLINWVLCAVTYSIHTADHAWLAARKNTLAQCVESLLRRDHPDPAQRTGLLKCDSVRCGAHGSEITTYDSLDVSLGQARNNLYLSVKALAAWQLLAAAFDLLADPSAAASARASADLAAAAVSGKFEKETGCFPAVFENGNQSRILPAIEGLAFPLFLDLPALRHPSPAVATLISLLRRHLESCLRPGVCLDSVTGGWKLSSSSTNTWFSKIALAQYVIRNLFPGVLTPAAVAADRVHATWQRTPGCGANAMCDQVNSDTGTARGSRYYPRCVTTWLWLLEPAPLRADHRPGQAAATASIPAASSLKLTPCS